jgi:transcriptional regulator with XRE-family HTH domain
MSPEQSRAARGWLGWSQTELADRASVSLSTVRDFENGHRIPITNNLDALRRAIEEAGVRLLFLDDGKPAGITIGDADDSSQRPRGRGVSRQTLRTGMPGVSPRRSRLRDKSERS